MVLLPIIDESNEIWDGKEAKKLSAFAIYCSSISWQYVLNV